MCVRACVCVCVCACVLVSTVVHKRWGLSQEQDRKLIFSCDPGEESMLQRWDGKVGVE